jgi:hypothetical protein
MHSHDIHRHTHARTHAHVHTRAAFNQGGKHLCWATGCYRNRKTSSSGSAAGSCHLATKRLDLSEERSLATVATWPQRVRDPWCCLTENLFHEPSLIVLGEAKSLFKPGAPRTMLNSPAPTSSCILCKCYPLSSSTVKHEHRCPALKEHAAAIVPTKSWKGSFGDQKHNSSLVLITTATLYGCGS